MWGEARIGCRFDVIERKSFDFFVMPQMCGGMGIFRTNP